MSDSTASQTCARFSPLVIMVVFFALFVAWTMFSGHRNSNSPNDAIGRNQMQVTNSGTIIVMDTVTGEVTHISKIEDYSIGGRTFGDKPSKVLPTPAR